MERLTKRTTEEIKGKLELAQKEDSADGVAAWTVELFKTITDGILLDRLEEICNAERDGRCVVLMPQIEFDERLEKLRSVNWKVNSLCRDCGGVPKHLEAELFDMLGVKKAPDGYIDTREAAEAALREREQNDRN